MNIIHGDLHLKIASFGLSKQLTEVTYNSMNNRMGIIEYVEPRCLRNVIYVKDKRSDVYSLSILLYKRAPSLLLYCRTSYVRSSRCYMNLREESNEAITSIVSLKYQNINKDRAGTNYVRDGKSSIYSLGVLFWEIISGQPPRDDRLEPINMIPSCHA
ncbi:unnamed protein product [Rhizophagus irregularis]|nr:unnamed protein product [Rhizophagus irregularis]